MIIYYSKRETKLHKFYESIILCEGPRTQTKKEYLNTYYTMSKSTSQVVYLP